MGIVVDPLALVDPVCVDVDGLREVWHGGKCGGTGEPTKAESPTNRNMTKAVCATCASRRNYRMTRPTQAMPRRRLLLQAPQHRTQRRRGRQGPAARRALTIDHRLKRFTADVAGDDTDFILVLAASRQKEGKGAFSGEIVLLTFSTPVAGFTGHAGATPPRRGERLTFSQRTTCRGCRTGTQTVLQGRRTLSSSAGRVLTSCDPWWKQAEPHATALEAFRHEQKPSQ